MQPQSQPAYNRSASLLIGAKRPRVRHAAGVALIEAMVAVLLFAVGIIGLLSVQGNAYKTVMASKGRTDASNLADQIIGQMWLNRNALASYALNTGGTVGGGTCSPTGGGGNGDTSAWAADVAKVLPAAKQQITIGANNLVTVSLCWKYPQESTPHNYTMTAQING